MYVDKIKKELFDKIVESLVIVEEQQEIEQEIEDGTRSPEDGFDGGLERYVHLEGELNELLEEIDALLIETKYFPLVGLTDTESTLFKGMSGEGVEAKNIEKYLDTTLTILKENMKERLQKVKTLFLKAHIRPRIHCLYREVIKCYINGSFEASCVLCRAIAESIAKKYIEDMGYGDLLVAKNKHLKVMSIQEILDKKLSLPIETIGIYSKIANKADKILHEKADVAEEDALKAIQLLQSFIEKFPKTL